MKSKIYKGFSREPPEEGGLGPKARIKNYPPSTLASEKRIYGFFRTILVLTIFLVNAFCF